VPDLAVLDLAVPDVAVPDVAVTDLAVPDLAVEAEDLAVQGEPPGRPASLGRDGERLGVVPAQAAAEPP
jgi:hypothetical protein